MNKILVPTDFSEQADNALLVAAQLAKKYNAEIYLLHLLELPINEVDAMGTHSDIPEAVFFMKLTNKRFEEVLNKEYLKDIIVHDTIEFHKAFDGIMDTCSKYNIDLIVMGSHGVSGLKEMFIGSNTEKVVRSSEIPVLVIKNKHNDFDITNFVFASSFKPSNKKAYDQAVNLAKSFNAKLHLVLINTANRFITTEKANTRIKEFLSYRDYDNITTSIYNDESIELGILNYAQSVNADIIGIGTHGRQGIAHFFNGSISEDLVNHAKRPVVTFKIK